MIQNIRNSLKNRNLNTFYNSIISRKELGESKKEGEFSSFMAGKVWHSSMTCLLQEAELIHEELKASPCCSSGPEILALNSTIWTSVKDKVKPPMCICLVGQVNFRARVQAASWAPSTFFLGGMDRSKVLLPS